MSTEGPPPTSSRLKRLYGWWATRSLLIGAVATLVDVSIGTFLLSVVGLPTLQADVLALAVGTTLNFLAHRYFAFREKNPKLADPAVRWILVTLVQVAVHGQLVTMLRDWWGVPFVPAKMAADLLVFTVAQLLLVRYFVFGKKKDSDAPVESAEPATSSPSE
jgi:putative flippase GtrA